MNIRGNTLVVVIACVLTLTPLYLRSSSERSAQETPKVVAQYEEAVASFEAREAEIVAFSSLIVEFANGARECELRARALHQIELHATPGEELASALQKWRKTASRCDWTRISRGWMMD